MLLAVEQLRRRVPGGIGAYARGLLGGLAVRRDGGRRGRGGAPGQPGAPGGTADPLAAFGRPLHTSRLPGRLLTRAWDHGLTRAPAGFDVVHSVSLASPQLRRSSPERLVVTVHDVAWRRHPEATTRRGRALARSRLAPGQSSEAALVVPSRLVAADLAAMGVAEEPDHRGAERRRSPARARCRGRRRASPEGWASSGSSSSPWARSSLARTWTGWCGPSRGCAARSPGPWPLVIVGPAGWGPEPADPRAADHVVFTGPVPDVVLSELYRRARAFAYVPLTEGYGLPPLEAMLVGVPTVVSDEVPSVRDLGAAGPAPARIVDPLDVDDIAGGLAAVLTDDGLRAELASRGAALRVAAHLARAPPAPTSTVAVVAVMVEQLDLSLDVSAVPVAAGRRRLLHHGAGPRPRRARRRRADPRGPPRRRARAGAAWPVAPRCAARCPPRGRAGWPSSSSGSVPCCVPSGSRCTTVRTTPCPPGRRCRVR